MLAAFLFPRRATEHLHINKNTALTICQKRGGNIHYLAKKLVLKFKSSVEAIRKPTMPRRLVQTQPHCLLNFIPIFYLQGS